MTSAVFSILQYNLDVAVATTIAVATLNKKTTEHQQGLHSLPGVGRLCEESL